MCNINCVIHTFVYLTQVIIRPDPFSDNSIFSCLEQGVQTTF